MKAIERFLGLRRLAILTAVCYILWSVTNVVEPWLIATGPEKFEDIIMHPLKNSFHIVSLSVGIVSGIIQAIRSLLNKDFHDEKARPVESEAKP